VKAQLLGARRQLEKCGWVGAKLEPWCRDGRGRRVHHADEAVHTFSLCGALQLYGQLEPAWELLGRVVSPGLARLADFVDANASAPFVPELGDFEPSGAFELESPAERTWWQLQAAADGEFLSFTGWLLEHGRTREDLLRTLLTAAARSTREKRT
jgi:hypothetical protein